MKTEKFINITIAYMRNIGEYGSKNKELMEAFKDFLKTNNLFNHEAVGIQTFWESIPKLTADLSVDYGKPIIERYTMEKINNQLCEFCIPLK